MTMGEFFGRLSRVAREMRAPMVPDAHVTGACQVGEREALVARRRSCGVTSRPLTP